MTPEENKKIILRLFGEGMMEKKFEVFNELIAENFINHGIPNAETGPTGFKMFAVQLFKAFPNLKIIIDEIIAEEDIVAVRGYIIGTHQGEFMGIHPTGKKN